MGGTNVVFSPNTDAATAASTLPSSVLATRWGRPGSGLLAALQFDAVGPGTSQLTVSGVMANPTGGAIPVQFVPASVVVR